MKKRFFEFLESKLGNVKPLISEQEQTSGENLPVVSTIVKSEGVKNVTNEMVTSPEFDGSWGGSVISGVFKGTKYEWDLKGVFNLHERGEQPGKIISDFNKNLKLVLGGLYENDGIPEGVWVGFKGRDRFLCYMTTSNTPKCVRF